MLTFSERNGGFTMWFRFSVMLVGLLSVGCPGLDIGSEEECRAAAPSIRPDTLPDGTVNEAYSQQLTAFGSEEVFSLDTGALPDGLSLSEDGLISGTPSAAGNFEFSVQSTVDDSEAKCPVHPAFADFTLTVAEAD